MEALRVALVVKPTPASFERENRGMGYWSYPVPEFTWEHFTLGKGWRHDTALWKDQGFDLVFHEDGGNYGEYSGPLPVIYFTIDSTLSEEHYLSRYAQAQRADLVLVEHDDLDRFRFKHKSTRRLPYCVNDRIYHDYGMSKSIDVAFHCNTSGPGGNHRGKWKEEVRRVCTDHHYLFRTGVIGNPEYAKSFNAARASVNVPRTERNRPHRVLDVMASRSCLVTQDLPSLDFCYFPTPGEHYLSCNTPSSLADTLVSLLEGKDGMLQRITESGYRYVMDGHTWSTRAGQLRQIIKEELGL